jgi:hypothetical protein
MKSALLILFVVALLLSSCAATLRVHATIPLINDDAICGQPPVTSTGTDSVWCVFRAPSANVADSVWDARGRVVSRSWPASAGFHDITCYIARVVNGVWVPGCSVTLAVEAVGKPARPTLAP